MSKVSESNTFARAFSALVTGVLLILGTPAFSMSHPEIPRNIYAFPIPEGFRFSAAPRAGAEVWLGKRNDEVLQISRLSDLHTVVRTKKQAESYLAGMIQLRQTGLIGIAKDAWTISQAKYRFDRTHQGWVFFFSGDVMTTFDKRVRFIEQTFVIGQEVYEVFYTESGDLPVSGAKIQKGLHGFWPRATETK
jgi:hypothetical protein